MISFIGFKKVAFVGGGTGGHVTPIVALVHEQREQAQIDYLWIGGAGSLEEATAQKENIRFYPVKTLKVATTKSLSILLYPFTVLRGVITALSILKKEKPDIVFSKGGPGSVSVGIASWILRIPLWIHESDTVAGRSNKFLGRFATRIFLGFDAARKYFPELRCTVVGQILDPDIRKTPKEYRYWKTDKKHILVICGSQGSKNIFEAIAHNCGHLDAEWIVLLGLLNKDARYLFGAFQNITLYDWVDAHTLGSILSKTDLVITRGSATSLAEIDLYQRKKVIIPLPWSSDNHQYHNALWYQENRGDTVITEDDLADALSSRIGILLPETIKK